MEGLDIVVKILGVGLSGFGFLLMYLAYKLIDRLIDKESVSSAITKMINRYIIIGCIMTVIVGGFTFVTAFYKNDLISEQGKEIASLQVIETSYQNIRLKDSVLQELRADRPVDLSGIAEQQARVLQDLQAQAEAVNDTAASKEIARYNMRIASLLDTIGPGQGDATLKERYIRYTEAIDSLSRDLSRKIRSKAVPARPLRQ